MGYGVGLPPPPYPPKALHVAADPHSGPPQCPATIQPRCHEGHWMDPRKREPADLPGDPLDAVTEMGAIVMPPVPAFYAMPKTIEDLVAHTVGRILDLFGVHSARLTRWQGMKGNPQERD